MSAGERRRIADEDRGHDRDRRRAGERAAPRQHLVEHDAEREDVGAMVRGVAVHLLRRHVAHGPHHDAGHRLWRGGQRRVRQALGGWRRELGQAEVEDLDAVLRRDEDVRRLQVAMDDALLVGCAQPVRDLRAEVERAAQRQPSPRQQPVERRAVEELGNDVGEAALDADVEDRDDVGVVEGGRGPGLLLEPAQAVGVVGHLGGQHLDRDLAIEALVVSAVDLAHPAGPEWRDDLVRAEARAWGQRHGVIILGSGTSTPNFQLPILNYEHPTSARSSPWELAVGDWKLTSPTPITSSGTDRLPRETSPRRAPLPASDDSRSAARRNAHWG